MDAPTPRDLSTKTAPDIPMAQMDKHPTSPDMACGSHALEENLRDLDLSVRL